MSTAEPSRIVRFLPSLTDAAFLVPLLFLFLRLPGGYHLLTDGDTGWHLRAGMATTVPLPVHTPFVGAFEESERWRPAYGDGIAIVFRSAQALASAPGGEEARASVSEGLSPNDRNKRGRETTKSNQADPRITQPRTRSEIL